MKLEKIMLEDLVYVNYNNYEELEGNLEVFLKAGNGDKIVNDYKQAEKDGISLYNSVEVRTQLLQDNLSTFDENLEDYSVLYSDVNLESIAEILQDVTIEDLERELGHYGIWQICSHDGLYTLISLG